MRLTKEAVAALALPPGKVDHFEWDDSLPSFGVRLRGQAKSWVVQYRVGRQQRRESLGDVRKVSLDAARQAARQRFAQVQLGVDPTAQRRQVAAPTLKQVIDRYLDAKRDRLRPASFKAAARYFAVHWQPLHGRPLDTIKRPDVAAVLQDSIAAHGRTSAARARANLSALYGWAMREGLAEVNPTLATKNPLDGVKCRERVLNAGELAAVWRAAAGDNESSGRIVRVLILTGCRREEIGGLRWSEINFETGVLTIPGERTKNHRTLELPLPEPALAILRATPRQDGNSFVFGKSASFSGWSAAKLRLDARITMAEGWPLAPWRLHDLRRTMRTGLGQLGVAPHVAELAINHVKGGIQAVYDKHRYKAEIGAALALWGDHVLAAGRGPAIEGHQLTRLNRAAGRGG